MQRKYILIGLSLYIVSIGLFGWLYLNQSATQSQIETPLSVTVTKIRPSVVAVFSNKDDFFSIDNDTQIPDFKIIQSAQVGGSAFVIDNKGYILTNKHVLDDNSNYFVILDDNTHVKIDKIWFHPTLDLAIAHIDTNKHLTSLLISNIIKQIGDDVFTLGTPFSQYINTLSVGVISAKDRTLNLDNGKIYTGLYQLDMEINPGNSGGPLFDKNGEVIGIVTAKTIQSNHLGFAIPLSDKIVSQFFIDIQSNSNKPIQL